MHSNGNARNCEEPRRAHSSVRNTLSISRSQISPAAIKFGRWVEENSRLSIGWWRSDQESWRWVGRPRAGRANIPHLHDKATTVIHRKQRPMHRPRSLITELYFATSRSPTGELRNAVHATLPEIASTLPTSVVLKPKPPFFNGLTAHSEKICSHQVGYQLGFIGP